METVSEMETSYLPHANHDRSAADSHAAPEAPESLRVYIAVRFNMTNKYMTTKQVANELEVSVATVCRWVRDGIIPAKRFGKRIIKIPCVEVERLLNQNQAAAVN